MNANLNKNFRNNDFEIKMNFEIKNYQPHQKLLNKKIILITGASDGIGREIAKTYAFYGATVILHGRDNKKLESLYDEINEQGFPKPAMIPLDFAKANTHDYQCFYEAIKKEFGQLDGLVHNAAKLDPLTPIEFSDTADWLDTMQVNINAVYLLTHFCFPLLKKSKRASIITTTSSVGRKGKAFWGSYSVSKFAIEGFTQLLAEELENSSIRINAINPGAIKTNMRAKAYPAEDASQLKSAKSIMSYYLYLMGEDSLCIHGKSINAQ
jgi:NAD(P)-dependent dehydrogenase (short-subunit alcohol dehydrogenase family)